MPVEISYLIASVGLFIVMIVFQALCSIGSQSITTLVGPRDEMQDKTAMSGRARRANMNMVEAMVLFTPLILAAAYLDRFNAMTALGAALFFWGRVAFAPSYWFGWPWLRTVIWFVSVVGILMIFFQILPFSSAA